mgnify:CR=1 FL=1
MKFAIISGATGQDGSYLAELLLEKEYTVHCIVRRSTRPIEESNLTPGVINHPNSHFHTADLTDQPSLKKIFDIFTKEDYIEVYNLGAQSHVGVSFECPISTVEINTIGTLNLLECAKEFPNVRFYQASTSEMFGKVHEVPQKETTPFHPRSPYGVAKMAAHWMVKNYRETYGMFTSCGILFNHESPRRGDNFVTQKIIKGVKRVIEDETFVLELGNLESMRDWGHAKDYVYAMWMMLQQDTPDDYVVSMGESYSVRHFVTCAFNYHKAEFRWAGDKGYINGREVVRVSPKFYRPCEVDQLLGDSSKIRALGWKPQFSFSQLVEDMAANSS